MNTLKLLTVEGLRLGFTGSHLGMIQAQAMKVLGLLSNTKWKEFHHGDCVGADAETHDMIRKIKRNITIIGHPPDDPKARAFKRCDMTHPVKPYLVRNHDIVDATDLLIGAPGSFLHVMRSGTWATLRYAAKQQRPLIIITPRGSMLTELPKQAEDVNG